MLVQQLRLRLSTIQVYYKVDLDSNMVTAVLATRRGVLECIGSVGQRFILLMSLHRHPKVLSIGASARLAGQRYKDAVR